MTETGASTGLVCVWRCESVAEPLVLTCTQQLRHLPHRSDGRCVLCRCHCRRVRSPSGSICRGECRRLWYQYVSRHLQTPSATELFCSFHQFGPRLHRISRISSPVGSSWAWVSRSRPLLRQRWLSSLHHLSGEASSSDTSKCSCFVLFSLLMLI